MIYDCFLFNGEFDLLEIRLAELAGTVDRFVIVEANQTFSGQPKAFSLEAHWHRVQHLKDHISYVQVKDLPEGISPEKAWEREFASRNAFKRAFTANSTDVVCLSDCDEIPRAQTLKKFCPSNRLMGWYPRPYWFYFNYWNKSLEFRMNGRMWPKLVSGRTWNAQTPQEIRFHDPFTNGLCVYGGGWDFCFMGGSQEIARKAAAGAHYSESGQFISDYAGGADPLKRDGHCVEKVPINALTHPARIANHQQEWVDRGYILP